MNLGRVTLIAALALGACALETLGNAPPGSGPDAGPDTGSGGTVVDDASFGGSSGSTPDAADALESEPAVALPYGFRRQLVVTPGSSSLPKGASLLFRFDHHALVLAGKARADGKDLRVFHKGAGPLAELDRVLDPISGWDRAETTIWFRTEAELTQPDGSYYLYYGDPAPAGDPPEDPNQVYLFFDHFSGSQLSAGWTGSAIGSATGTFTVNAGMVRLEGTTGDIWNAGDSFLFLHRPMKGNFVVDARVVAAGGANNGWAKLGGAMVRGTLGAGSRNRLVSPVNGSAAITSSYRLDDGAITDEDSKPGAKLLPEFVRIARRFDGTRAWHSEDALTYTELGAEKAFVKTLPDQVSIGIPFANNTAGKGWVDIDWFRVRVLLEAEPTLAEQPEEPGPFFP